MARALDHLVIPARDLTAQAELYRRLGFNVGALNRHPWGTENHIIQVDGVFLELIGLGEGFQDAEPNPFSAFVARYLKAREGLAMLALRSADAEADRRDFESRGLGRWPRFDFARQGRRPDGSETEVAFSLAFAASPDWPETGFFVCQQHFPQNFWSPAAQIHPNGATRVSALTFVHPRPAAGAAFLAAFTASPTLTLENCEIAVEPGAEPGLSAMTIRVGDLEAQARRLADAGVAFTRQGGALVVSPAAAMGVEIRFV